MDMLDYSVVKLQKCTQLLQKLGVQDLLILNEGLEPKICWMDFFCDNILGEPD